MTLQEAASIVRDRLENREESFLRLVESGVYGHRSSPYLPLLRQAGCEHGDLRALIRDRGLEKTLLHLRKNGVFVTFEEFKGRVPIERGGLAIRVTPRDFDNPFLSRSYEAASGGTTGSGTRVNIDLEHLEALAPTAMLTYHAHGILDAPTAFWFGILPDGTGIGSALVSSRFGRPPAKWFSPVGAGDAARPLRHRLAQGYVLALSRALGVGIPPPETVRLGEAAVVARWAARSLAERGSCLLRTQVSKALRVSLAAQEEGLDLTGAVFMAGGEPPTPAKVRGIRNCGARFVPNYFFDEAGVVGQGCARPLDENDLHFIKDRLAVIQHPRVVPGTRIEVNAFNFTGLSPTAPKILLNVESDDYGVLEKRSCGCPLEEHGFTEHLREVRSFSKLTGEGVTLVGSEMVRILEEVLPARFGGSPLDYQLLEEEDERGFTRMSLLMAPAIGEADEREVLGVVMDALASAGMEEDLARANWREAEALRVQRRDPVWTDRGKLMPLHLARRSEATGEPGGT